MLGSLVRRIEPAVAGTGRDRLRLADCEQVVVIRRLIRRRQDPEHERERVHILP